MRRILNDGPKGEAGVGPRGGAAGATPKDAAISRAKPYIKHVEKIHWTSVGTFLEEVGFDHGPVAVDGNKDVAEFGGVAGFVDRAALYTDTYLYFSRASSPQRAVLTYTLLQRLSARRGRRVHRDHGKWQWGRRHYNQIALCQRRGVGHRTQRHAGLSGGIFRVRGANALVLVSNAGTLSKEREKRLVAR